MDNRFSGSGKSEISYKIKKKIENNFGKTIIINGDNFRKSFNLKNYDKFSRIELGKQYINFLKIILDQNINVIFSVVSLYNDIRNFGRKKNKKLCRNFYRYRHKKIKKNSKKIHYRKQKNILGLDLKPEIPKNLILKYQIILKNLFLKFLRK